mmetsp:Transcript_2479/g.3438  ORF Transcript_2479/g.3438 Transcript_2479/m.3438 type:complete len:80 (+) Transcript_2479:195-434(+)
MNRFLIDENFFLEYDHGSGHTKARRWQVGNDFSNDEVKQNLSVQIYPSGGLSNKVTLRFRCGASSDNDRFSSKTLRLGL